MTPSPLRILRKIGKIAPLFFVETLRKIESETTSSQPRILRKMRKITIGYVSQNFLEKMNHPGHSPAKNSKKNEKNNSYHIS